MNEQQELLNGIKELRQLYPQLKLYDPVFGEDSPFLPSRPQPSSNQSIGNFYFKGIEVLQKVSSYNNTSLLGKVWSLFRKLESHEKQLPSDVQTMLITIRASKEVFSQKINITIEPNSTKEIIVQQPNQSAPSPVINNQPSYTIRQMFDSMLLKGNNCHTHRVRKTNAFELMLKGVGLKWDDDYSKFHNIDTIEKMTRNIMTLTDMKNEGKRTRLGYIKELVTCAWNIEPDYYKINVIANLPKVPKSKKSLLKPHLPYSKEQLLTIFDPKYDFFKKNPDGFWLCLLGLFTGARANAAMTLQYGDIINEENLDCIYFRSNHTAKNLKTDASERKVPIHNQLLDLGFVDYVRRKQKKTKASDKDFIFSCAVTKTGKYNNKYMDRQLFPFFKSIGVKSEKAHDGADFHSFRKVLSGVLQDAGLAKSYVNQIGGWEGTDTVDKSYSNHTLAQIKAQMDKVEYDFLKPHFAVWKKIMAKKT